MDFLKLKVHPDGVRDALFVLFGSVSVDRKIILINFKKTIDKRDNW